VTGCLTEKLEMAMTIKEIFELQEILGVSWPGHFVGTTEDLINYLRVSVLYQQFDLEATRRNLTRALELLKEERNRK